MTRQETDQSPERSIDIRTVLTVGAAAVLFGTTALAAHAAYEVATTVPDVSNVCESVTGTNC